MAYALNALESSSSSSSSSTNDPFHPSFFELAAQDQLRDLIKPATRYVLVVFAQRHPRYLLKLVNRFDEVYHLVLFALESHYLRVWGSSFSEHFYRLKRRRRPALSTLRAQQSAASSTSSISALTKTETLRPRQIRLSLLFLVILPYFQSKMRDLWERHSSSSSSSSSSPLSFSDSINRSEQSSKTKLEKLKTLLIRSYPYFSTGWNLWMLSYNVGYLFSKTPYWRPWLSLMRVDLRRRGGSDQSPLSPIFSSSLSSISRNPLRWISILSSLTFESFQYLVPFSIFFFKFLEWWYSNDNPRRSISSSSSSNNNNNNKSIIQPPQILLPHSNGIQKITYNQCPICQISPIQNPAILPTGYVFCYTCIFQHLDKNLICPVTLQRVPDGIQSLRKVLG